MSPPSGNTTRELLRLYSLASRGEYNLVAFIVEHPELVARLGIPLDLEGDDAGLALQLASAVGRYKRRAVDLQAGERAERAVAAASRLVACSRQRAGSFELAAGLLLGDLLVDSSKKFISFELPGVRVPVLRGSVAKARAPLRDFIDVVAFVDECGLHLRWRGGRGGLNFHPQTEQRGAAVLHVDLRPATPVRRRLPRPVLLADVLAELGLI